MREHVYEVVSNTGNSTEVVATFWWDGKKVQCDKQTYLDYANERGPCNRTSDAGLAFLEVLPMAFKNGYVTCRRAKKSE